jgi:Mg/Co/Ni transporter MgtE
MNRRIHLQLHSGEGWQPTRASRLKGIAIGLFSALVVAALLFVALILGSVIAVVIGIVVIAAIAFVIVRATFMGPGSPSFNRRGRRGF